MRDIDHGFHRGRKLGVSDKSLKPSCALCFEREIMNDSVWFRTASWNLLNSNLSLASLQVEDFIVVISRRKQPPIIT
jgi:hypothetical protein